MNLIPIRCKTNLDLEHEIWPTELPYVPRIGDYIVSARQHKDRQSLTLRVATVMVKPYHSSSGSVLNWQIELELSPGPEFYSIAEFENWYAKLCGRITLEQYRARYQELQKNKL